jgi:hypothetical protein
MLPCDEEMHADLMSWVIKSCDIMSKLQTLLTQHSLIDEAMIQIIQSDLSSLMSSNTEGSGSEGPFNGLSRFLLKFNRVLVPMDAIIPCVIRGWGDSR